MDTADPESTPDETAPQLEGEQVAVLETEFTPIVDGVEHSVDPASIVLHRLIGMVPVIAVGAVVFVAFALVGVLSGIPRGLHAALLVAWAIVAAGLGYLAWRWPILHHRYLRYRVDTSGILIRRGVLWRQVVSIPTSRVQHMDVTQGPLQRNYGLATLIVHTAGTKSASIELSGLNHAVALRLRDHLLPQDGV